MWKCWVAISTDMSEPKAESSSKTLCDPQSGPRDKCSTEASPEEAGLVGDLEHLSVPPSWTLADQSQRREDLR